MKQLFILVLMAVASAANGQNLTDILQSVEERNTTLAAARSRTQAASLEALSGIWLENPEVEFSYLWGRGANRQMDVSATQSFDFPSVYVRKRQMGELSGAISGAEYRSMRREVLLEAWSVCVELTYLNAMQQQLNQRVAHSQKLASAFDTKLASGAASVIERNKAHKLLLSTRTQQAELSTQRIDALSRLAALNGGVAVEFSATRYPTQPLPASFDRWFDTMALRNPALEAMRIDVERAARGVQLAKATGAPSFALGYKNEGIGAGEQFQGLVASMSIPLWQNKNALKASKATLRAAQHSAHDAAQQFALAMQALYHKSSGLEALVEEFRQAYGPLEGLALLDRALAGGEISLLDYLVELTENYNLMDEQLRLDRDLHLALAELYSFNL